MTARLIVTADDVGLHPGTTEGAIAAHRDGIVTACSVAANGLHVEGAAARLREHPLLAPGVHFTLVGEAPVAPPERVRSLLGRDGRLFDDWSALLRRWIAGRLHLDQVEVELRAQVAKLRSLGLAPIHANGHQHLHVLPGIFDRVLRIAADEDIGYLRIPGDPRRAPWPPRRAALVGLEVCGRLARRRATAQHPEIVLPDATAGLGVAGHLDLPSLLAIVADLRGLVELVVHPGVGGETIAKHYAWGYRWDLETAVLCSPAVRQALTIRGIELRSIAKC